MEYAARFPKAPSRRSMVAPIAALLVGAGVATGAYALIDDSNSASQPAKVIVVEQPARAPRRSPARTRRRRRPRCPARAASSRAARRRAPPPDRRRSGRERGAPTPHGTAHRAARLEGERHGHALRHRQRRRAAASGPARHGDLAAQPLAAPAGPRTWRLALRHHSRRPADPRRGACAFPAPLDGPLTAARFVRRDAGWSSQVARRAHNPKVAGSNPAPATFEVESRSPNGCLRSGPAVRKIVSCSCLTSRRN